MAFSARADPSVAIRICPYMMNLPSNVMEGYFKGARVD
jgi:hypothetical protein